MHQQVDRIEAMPGEPSEVVRRLPYRSITDPIGDEEKLHGPQTAAIVREMARLPYDGGFEEREFEGGRFVGRRAEMAPAREFPERLRQLPEMERLTFLAVG
jgi:hypothetical protein